MDLLNGDYMSVTINTLTLGPLTNNVYFITDSQTGETIIVDPTYQSRLAFEEAQKNHWNISRIWITHAHFDHIAGVDELVTLLGPQVQIGLHPDDLTLWQNGGGARDLGFFFEVKSEPTFFFHDKQEISFHGSKIEIRLTPGHTNGHVIFYFPAAGCAICGDLIFRGSVGRTDLRGGNHSTLLRSIKTQILTLPLETRLLSGHGPETTVAQEFAHNPFLK